MVQAGFHDGELAVQDRAGVRAQVARLGSAMLAAPDLNGGLGDFLAKRELAVLTARDGDGRLWTSPIFSKPGFLEARDTELRVHSMPGSGDPLHAVAEGELVGILAIEFATRRRVRVNGTIAHVGNDSLLVSVDQAFGNCPKYIQQRHLEHIPQLWSSEADRSTTLNAEHAALIAHADTFFLGTIHPDRGADTSHRGGSPGFVHVDDGKLCWPDYPGNNMFNSFGNLAVDASAALLFVDFETGATLHMSGTAAVEWLADVKSGDGETGRRVTFTIESLVSGLHLGMRSDDPQPSPHNPSRPKRKPQ